MPRALGGVGTLAALVALLAPGALSSQTPPPKKFPAGSSTLVYYELGPHRGRPFVLLSGGPGYDSDYFWFGPVFHDLAKTRWVVTYDQRGTGRSAPVGPKDSVTVADFVADLEALRVALKVEQIDLLGHSWGGYLAQAYAAAHGDRVAHLVLVGSAAPKFSDTIFLFSQVFPERDMNTPFRKGQETGDTAQIHAALRVYTTMIFYSPEHGEAWRGLGSHLKFNHFQSNQLQRDLAKLDFTPKLADFKFPVLVTTGRYDMNVAPLTAYRIHQAIPGSKFHVFEKSSHITFYEEPAAFNTVVGEFLSH
jgi:proline iminopeptidase